MSRKIEVVYENGMLRPVEPLELGEHQRLTVTLDASQGEEDVIERPYTPPAEGKERREGAFGHPEEALQDQRRSQ